MDKSAEAGALPDVTQSFSKASLNEDEDDRPESDMDFYSMSVGGIGGSQMEGQQEQQQKQQLQLQQQRPPPPSQQQQQPPPPPSSQQQQQPPPPPPQQQQQPPPPPPSQQQQQPPPSPPQQQLQPQQPLPQGAAADVLDTDAEELAPRDSRTGCSGLIEKPEERGPVGSRLAPSGSNPIEGAVGVTGDASIDIPDKQVPTYLRLPQTDFAILVAANDRVHAEELCKELRSEDDDVTGDCYDVNMVEIGDSTEQIHSLRPAAVGFNLQRTTHVLSYITKAFLDQEEVSHYQYQCLDEKLHGPSNGKTIIPMWVNSKEDLRDYAKKSLKRSGLASCLLMYEGVRCSDKNDVEKLKRMLKGSKLAKESRLEEQRRQINEWKEKEAFKRKKKKVPTATLR